MAPRSTVHVSERMSGMCGRARDVRRANTPPDAAVYGVVTALAMPWLTACDA